MLKVALFRVQSMKTATVWIEDRVFALFFRPYHGAFGSSSVPAPGNLLIQGKNNANAPRVAYRGSIQFRASSLSPFSLKFLAEALSVRRLICLDYIRRIQKKFSFETKPYESSVDKENNKIIKFSTILGKGILNFCYTFKLSKAVLET